jgi:hypothetical protein
VNTGRVVDDAWRPACGVCRSTAIRVSTGACDDCGAPWDGSETGEPVREDDPAPTPALDDAVTLILDDPIREGHSSPALDAAMCDWYDAIRERKGTE